MKDAGNAPLLEMGVNAFTEVDLLHRAAGIKGLELFSDGRQSKVIKEYPITPELTKLLEQQGFKFSQRPDCGYDTVTLTDTGFQRPTPGYTASNYWNFKQLEKGGGFDIRFSLRVDLAFSMRHRGIVLHPKASGSFVSPTDSLPNIRLFKLLVGQDNEASSFLKTLAAESAGRSIVSWTELGVGGLRSLYELFHEFSNGKDELSVLAHHGTVFDPPPFPAHSPRVYVAETIQPAIMDGWAAQRDEYISRLKAA